MSIRRVPAMAQNGSMTPIAARPVGPVEVPERVRAIAGADAVEPVWRNQLGGVTFRLAATDGGERFVKWSGGDAGAGAELTAEAGRLAWASEWTSVPRVLDAGRDETGAWLVTRGIPARSAVDPRWLADPHAAVRAVGRGLRSLHDALPVDACPFEWSLERRVIAADRRLAAGMRPTEWFPEHAGYTVSYARGLLHDAPPIDLAVVCHGDPCAPNTLIDDDGRFAAHVDLGSLGTADRWADIAVAAWSTEWNYGPGFAPLLYEAYGVEPDTERIAYYRLLWDLT
jgi:kanamycin kinase